jgi:anti-repressor protein
VSARELYEFLELDKSQWARWTKKNIEEIFEENQEYQRLDIVSNGNNTTEYILKLDVAKELAMLSRSEKGKEIRKYFIELEKAWNSPEKIMARALQIANHQIETYKQQIEYQKPLVEFADKMLGSKDSLLIRVYAKLLNDEGLKIGEKKLYSWFRDNGYLNRSNEPYQQYMEYFEVKVSAYDTPFGTKTNTTTLIKPKGQLYFFKKLKEDRDVI